MNNIDAEKKITVLGKTFQTEEERREYFRNELRKHLPELKKMEGFPIGENEDIINLSDPPYYTACPNPWLNEFIEEWEQEKKEFERIGKRIPDFEIKRPYAHDVSVGKNNPVYKAHSYITKVPHPAIMRFILHYTQPGDIIFDGFSGTGMSGVASQFCEKPNDLVRYEIEKEFRENGKTVKWGERRFIGNDLSTLGSFIAHNFNHNVFLIEDFIKEISKLYENILEELGWMYETLHEDGTSRVIIDYVIWSDVFICNNCNQEMVYWDVAVNEKDQKVDENLTCPHCSIISAKRTLKKSFITRFDPDINETKKIAKVEQVLLKYTFNGKSYLKRPNEYDIKQLEKINNFENPNFFPKERMMMGKETRRNDKFGLTHVNDFFTNRNLIALSYIYSNLKNEHKVLFTALLNRGTKLNCTVMSNYFKQLHGKTVGGWAGKPREGTLYLPSISTEVNVIKTIKSRLSSISKLKTFTTNFKDNNSVLSTASSTNFSLVDSSVDYIFVDPPFGANRSYSELNFITESWLKVIMNNKMEAIENRAIGKSLPFYFRLMQKCFAEFYRILKPNGWMTVEFSNTNAGVWNGIQTSIQNVGFVISNVAGLDKKQGSIQSLTTVTAVKQDLIISCYKPSSEFDQKFQNHQNTELGIWDFVEENLNHLPIHLVKNNSTTAIIERSPKILFDRLIAFYIQRGLPVPMDASKFQKGLREHFIERDGMFFTNAQVQVYDKKKAAVPNFIQLSILVSTEQDGVLWLKNLLQKNKLTYQDIQPSWMQALAGVRKGDIIPELATILEENFLSDDEGRWYVPDPENEADLEKLRTKRLLKLFDGYKGIANKPKGKIKECRVDALRAGFKQCYQKKDFKTIVLVGDRIPNNLLMEDEVLLQFYDIASTRV